MWEDYKRRTFIIGIFHTVFIALGSMPYFLALGFLIVSHYNLLQVPKLYVLLGLFFIVDMILIFMLISMLIFYGLRLFVVISDVKKFNSGKTTIRYRLDFAFGIITTFITFFTAFIIISSMCSSGKVDLSIYFVVSTLALTIISAILNIIYFIKRKKLNDFFIENNRVAEESTVDVYVNKENAFTKADTPSPAKKTNATTVFQIIASVVVFCALYFLFKQFNFTVIFREIKTATSPILNMGFVEIIIFAVYFTETIIITVLCLKKENIVINNFSMWLVFSILSSLILTLYPILFIENNRLIEQLPPCVTIIALTAAFITLTICSKLSDKQKSGVTTTNE